MDTREPLQRLIREQLDRLLASATFRPSDQQKRFLNFICSETLMGRANDLKEYVIGIHVFRREETFDPRTDPVVRVQARRLRAKLQRYYDTEGETDSVLIDLPKGGYVPVFRERSVNSAPPPATRPSFPPGSVAISPIDAPPEFEAFAAGVTHEILRGLTRLPGVRVLTGPAGQSNARLLIVGSIRRASDGVRIQCELRDLEAGVYLASESTEVHNAESFASQEAVATAVVEAIRPHLTSSKRLPQTTENLTARNLCRQAYYHMEQRTDEAIERAAELFERAVVEDAQYALAHSGLSDAYSLIASYGTRPPIPAWNMALASAATAVMLDNESAPARTSLAHAKATTEWDYLGAEIEFHRAIRLDPQYAPVHHWYARCCLVPLGRLDEALEECTLARSMDPVSSIAAREIATTHYFRRDFEAALALCDQAIDMNPHFAHAYFTLSLVQEQLGDAEEALAALVRACQLAPKTPRMISALGWAQARVGNLSEAGARLEELDALRRHRYVSPWEYALIHLGLRDVERGLDELERACEDRCFELTLLNVDPRFDVARDNPRFAKLLRRLSLR